MPANIDKNPELIASRDKEFRFSLEESYEECMYCQNFSKKTVKMPICVLSVFCRGQGTVDALMCSVVSKFITQMVKDDKLFESDKNIMDSTNIVLPI